MMVSRHVFIAGGFICSVRFSCQCFPPC